MLDPGNAGFDEREGTFAIIHENKRQPTPGAMSYAYESLALPVFEPVGRAQVVKEPRKTFFAQTYTALAVRTNGVPITAGQVIMQPLYDPNDGYTSGTPINIPVQASMGVAAQTPFFLSTNDPSPDRLRGAP